MRPLAIAGTAAAALLVLTGCAAAAPGSAPTSAPAAPIATGAEQQARVAALPAPSSSEPVLAIGAVLDAGTPVLCLGGIMESYPPQCHGPELQGWDWSLVDFEEASGVRWIEGVAVPVTFDGPAHTATVAGELLDLATLSMPAPEIPSGTLTDAELEVLQLDLMEASRPDSLGSYGEDGTLVWQVLFDDGTLQDGIDEIYGEGRIFVLSALLGGPQPSADGDPGPAQVDLSAMPVPIPDGRVRAAGIALDGPDGEVLCQGDVGATLPPTCGGMPMTGFDWSAIAHEEASGARFVDAIVTGTWDGVTFVVDAPPQPRDGWTAPRSTPTRTDVPAEVSQQVQDDLYAVQLSSRDDILSHGYEEGFTWLSVRYDDGSMQAFLDDVYGEGVVVVSSSLTTL